MLNAGLILIIVTIFLAITMVFLGIYAVVTLLNPFSSAVIGLMKTPLGWKQVKLKLTKDGKLKYGKKEFTNWDWSKAVDMQIKRFGFSKVVKAFYFDPDSMVILDPVNPDSIKTEEAKTSMVIAQLIGQLAVNKSRERLLLYSIVMIIIVFGAVIGFMVYMNNKQITDIINTFNNMVQLLNQTYIPTPFGE